MFEYKFSLTSIIEVPVIIRSQMVNRPLRPPNPRGVDREDRPSPSANFIIRPHFCNFIRSLQSHFFVNCGTIRHEALHHNETARVAVEFGVFPPGLVEPVVDCVEAVDLGWKSEILGDCLPLFGNGFVQFPLPTDCSVEAVTPV